MRAYFQRCNDSRTSSLRARAISDDRTADKRELYEPTSHHRPTEKKTAVPSHDALLLCVRIAAKFNDMSYITRSLTQHDLPQLTLDLLCRSAVELRCWLLALILIAHGGQCDHACSSLSDYLRELGAADDAEAVISCERLHKHYLDKIAASPEVSVKNKRPSGTWTKLTRLWKL